MTSQNNQQNNRFSTLLVLIFCCLIASPLLLKPLLPTNTDTKLNNENRLAAKWPSVNVLKSDFVEYTKKVNDYLDDHLIFRNDLLDFYAKLHFKILKTGSNSNAIIGKDGWLFLSSSNALKNARGKAPISPEKSDEWATNAKLIKETVESYGGQFIVVIAPDKPQVYPEHLPNHIVYQRQGRRADNITDSLDKAGIDYLDLLDPLLAAKPNNQSLLYYQTDTHWTYLGALTASQEIVKKISSLGFSLPTFHRSYTRFVYRDNISGDLARLLNLEDIFNETFMLLFPNISKKWFTTDKSLLILGDSFTGLQIPYLAYSFTSVDCVHHNWGKINVDLLQEKQADIVVLQMIERTLAFPLSIGSELNISCGSSR